MEHLPNKDHILRRLIRRRKIDPMTGCWLWTGTTVNGYGRTAVAPSVNVLKSIFVHRLSAHLHLGFDLFSGLQVNHNCDTPLCFNPEHLKIGTQKENMVDCLSRGRRANIYGEANPMSKLTTEQVLKIRCTDFSKRGTKSAMARELGVNPSSITLILQNKNWSGVV